jgi:hypothetical protein
VRATLSTLKYARADHPSFSIALRSSVWASASSGQCVSMSRPASALFGMPWRANWRCRASTARSRSTALGSPGGHRDFLLALRGHFDLQVHAIEQRARDARLVALDLVRRAAAHPRGVAR